jgi:uncharacterized membrane protein
MIKTKLEHHKRNKRRKKSKWLSNAFYIALQFVKAITMLIINTIALIFSITLTIGTIALKIVGIAIIIAKIFMPLCGGYKGQRY